MPATHRADEPQAIADPTSRTTIFYYTGTGNSLWAARFLAQKIGNAEIIPMVSWDPKDGALNSQIIGLVFPVHIWGVPGRVLRFLDELGRTSPDYLFAVANNAGQVSNTLVQLEHELDSRNLSLSGGWSIELPSNYIPWGGPGPVSEQNRRFQTAETKLTDVAEKIRGQIRLPVEKGPLWQRVLFSAIYKLSLPQVHRMDKKFWADQRCNQCGLCAQICPAENIEIREGKIIWHNRCQQCLACIQWCPPGALQYGRRTGRCPRYHHPEIAAKDLRA